VTYVVKSEGTLQHSLKKCTKVKEHYNTHWRSAQKWRNITTLIEEVHKRSTVSIKIVLCVEGLVVRVCVFTALTSFQVCD